MKGTFANGCFWCTEAIFARVDGVKSVIPGYSGGSINEPTYEQVCSGTTGHAEAAQIEFDPDITSYEKLLDIFWNTHDPTTLNRQGNDIGTQYRSAIFYHDEEQKQIAEKSKKKLDANHTFNDPIVTEIVPMEKFFPAENYHHQYYENNLDAPYCQYVINPKVTKLLKNYQNELKSEFR